MSKLTKCQIEGIRLIADLFVYRDMTNEVMAKILTPEQLTQYKQHMERSMPVIHETGEELKRQILLVRAEYRELLLKDDVWPG